MSGLVRNAATPTSDSATTTNSVTVDLRAFMGKTPTGAGTTPTATVTATSTTAQTPKVVAKVGVINKFLCKLYGLHPY